MDDILIPKVDVRRADDRFKTRIGWLDSKHSFSFSHHYDPRNTHHGPLRQGDAVRLTGVGGQRLTATGDAEVLIWEMHAAAA